MKTIFLAVLILSCSLSALADDPNEKVLAAFNKTFQNVQNVKWTEGDNSYEVNFKQGVITSRVTYDKDGNILKTLRYYFQEQLPVMVLSKVKAKYPEHKIFGVVEESSDDGISYHITLEDEKNWIDITSDPLGSITVNKKFKKA